MSVNDAPREAATLAVWCCVHGTVFVGLRDDAGNVIAQIAFDVNQAVDVCDSFGNIVQEAVKIVAGDSATHPASAGTLQ